MRYTVSRHAEEEMVRRSIPRGWLRTLLANPEQVVDAYGGRKALQSRFQAAGDKAFLLRAIVDERGGTPVVVTVYRTTKVDKYWSSEA